MMPRTHAPQNGRESTTGTPDLALNKNLAVAALTQPARRLHRSLLTTFAETGRAPSRDELEQMAHDLDTEPGAAMAELVERDLLAVDARDEIRAAYPFSPIPTNHVLTWANGPRVHAMCAIDALGTSAMLDRPVTITSTEPGTGGPITIEVDRDHANWAPITAVVLAGATTDTCCPSVDRTCGHINFFTSVDAAQTWQTARPHLAGPVLEQAQALTFAIAEFGDFLQPAR